ncbi:sulfotransferase 1C2-like [Centruroides sculpturatus]|uniref:sulfotransferase 1C2-like n=1 Tax=Centruroides sculpturatus TaxID=218467 RepID=UPI000C6ED7C2|nr:sulfotransferase 1C2-like [Centruroides sculpturatus]
MDISRIKEKNLKEKERKLKLQNANGLLLTTVLSIKNLQQTISFQLQPNDVIIGGYPKSGTTWTQYIVWEIINEGAPLPSVNEIWYKEVPNLEMVGTDCLENIKSPRLFKVSLPFNYTPYCSSAKYIYVSRNPWDCCISAYNHFSQVDAGFISCTFDEYFECFINGEVSHGDYFDHLLSWYVHWDDPNFLFLTYENINRDTKNAVLKIAKFLDEKYYKTLTDNKEMFENILRQLKFEHMKRNCILERSNYSDNVDSKNEIKFFRSGTIGQWKQFLTENQKEKLKQKFIKKLNGTNMFSMWKNSDIS